MEMKNSDLIKVLQILINFQISILKKWLKFGESSTYITYSL